MKNGKQPITPSMYTIFGDGEDDYRPLKDGQKTGWEEKFGGLTKREYFAGLAMQGICSNETSGVEANAERIVFLSIEIADELLKQLENGK